MNDDALQKLISQKVSELAEHFDSVRIFATRNSEDGKCKTRAYDDGAGNFYAQFGQIKEWISIQDQFQRNWAMRRDNPENDKG